MLIYKQGSVITLLVLKPNFAKKKKKKKKKKIFRWLTTSNAMGK